MNLYSKVLNSGLCTSYCAILNGPIHHNDEVNTILYNIDNSVLCNRVHFIKKYHTFSSVWDVYKAWLTLWVLSHDIA